MSDHKEGMKPINNKKIISGNAQKPVSANVIVLSVIVLLAALGIGIVIKQIRSSSIEPELSVQASKTDDTNESREPEFPVYKPLPIEQVYVEPEPEPEPQEQQQIQEEPALVQEEPQETQNENPQVQDIRQWMSWLGTLAPQERMQLIQGVLGSMMSLMQRWQSIPVEQAQAESAELEQMFEQWRNLPAEQRQQGIQAIQQQLEQYLQAGQQ